MEAVLGPFQDIWDAWEPVNERTMRQPVDHFDVSLRMQLDEIEVEDPKSIRTTKEIIDIISLALNWMRWQGHTPGSIAALVKWRAETRYAPDPNAIFEKYMKLMPKGTIV